MLTQISRSITRGRVHSRIRRRARGGAEAPRLNVFRSSRHMYAQLVDDSHGHTLVAVSSLDKELREKMKGGSNISAAKEIGKTLAQRAKERGISRVVFDRGGYAYHGRVKALADAAREGGLRF